MHRTGEQAPAPSRIAAAARACLGGLGDLLLPAVCAACGADQPAAEGLCEACSRELLSLAALPYCPRCGTTLGPNIPADADGCQACPDPLPRFASVCRIGPYAGPLRHLVRELKYRRRHAARGHLTALLAERVKAACDGAPADVVVPVPMHWLRRLWRGFDHAGAIAAGLAGALRLPVGHELVRVRNTPPQVHLPRSRRLANVRGAFAVRSRAAVRGAAVLLVDDVTTVGATANEAARALLDAGADRVTLAVLAKSEAPTAYGEHFR